jgi:catechol 2,3-dioxygenase-like lactoylglutathione lyase family enzyme
MKIEMGHTEIFVKNPLTAKNFYVDVLGFEVEVIQHEKFVWLKKDSAAILLRPGNPQNPQTYQEANIAFVIYTDNLEDAKSYFRDKGVEFKGTDGSENCLTLTDNDGNWFQLVDKNNEH